MASPNNPISLFLIILTLFSTTHICSSIRDLKPQSISDVHDLLPKYGLPKGLLPNNVKSYSLSDDGSFEIELNSHCYVQFDRLVYYEKKIKGKLSYGSVSSVSGIQAKKLFFWVSVSAIKADKDSGMIEFYVGPVSEELPAEQFEVVPVCKSSACQGLEKLQSI